MPLTMAEVPFLIDAALKTYEETDRSKKVEEVVEKNVSQLLKEAVIEAENGVANDIYYLVRTAVSDHINNCEARKAIRRRTKDLVDSEDFRQTMTANLLATPTFTTPIAKFVTKKTEKAVKSESKLSSKIGANMPDRDEENGLP